MIDDRPIRAGAYRFWPPGTEPTPETAVIVGVRMDIRGDKHVVWKDGTTTPATKVKGQWEFIPEPPEERKVFRRGR
jgi:hypothetical protein